MSNCEKHATKGNSLDTHTYRLKLGYREIQKANKLVFSAQKGRNTALLLQRITAGSNTVKKYMTITVCVCVCVGDAPRISDLQ